MPNSFPREKVLAELHVLRDATQALHRRLESLISEIDGDSASDPRVVEIARRAIAELREKQSRRGSPLPTARNAERLASSAPSSGRSSERKPRPPRRQP